jgi:hypothetical protein
VNLQDCDDSTCDGGPTDPRCHPGTDVPVNHPISVTPSTCGDAGKTSGTCDEPNRLNKECDPGSHFKVLLRSDDAYIVGHCRKQGCPSGAYGDIAVIQYNRKNGATCFYQALASPLPGHVQAPSKGASVWPWLTPRTTARIGCAACHDNGPFIRSPYLNQIKGSTEPNVLPGSDDTSFNNDPLPYAFVGQDFASWKAFKVEIKGKKCTTCHRLGVSNVLFNGHPDGTALDFAERATSVLEISDVDSRDAHKTKTNPISMFSPIWMPFPGQFSFDQTDANAAKAIHDCALRFHELPNSDSCRITLFAQAYVPAPPPPPPPPETDIAAILELTQMPLR